MLTAFWQSLGEGLAGLWNSRTMTPAFAYWGGALLAWAWENGWQPVKKFLAESDALTGGALLIGGVFLLAVSAGLVGWMTPPILRLSEGYWPERPAPLPAKKTALFWRIWHLIERIILSIPAGLRDWLLKRVDAETLKERTELAQLNRKQNITELSREEVMRYARLDAQLDLVPVDARLRLPTQVGNILRAAEEYPYRCYGLEVNTTWPRLWMCLPESARKEVTEARAALNASAQLFAWGVAFIVWSVFAWWAIPVGVAIAVAAYLRMRSMAVVYGQMLRSAYDLHRFLLYENLRWPPPVEPEVEAQLGQALTLYLKRNIPSTRLPPAGHKLIFKHPKVE